MLDTVEAYAVTLGQWAWSVLRDHDWMLVIFTAILAIFTFRLWRTTHRDTRILQRAYIAVEPQGVHLLINGNDLIGHVGIKNAGHLPARKVSWAVNIKYSLSGDEPEASFPMERGEGNIVVAPGTSATQASGTSVKLQTLLDACGEEVARGDKGAEIDVFLYVWGSVQYDNGFRRSCNTKFCHRYRWVNRGRGHIGQYEIASAYARYHRHGNDAD
jgi:hypothetical protein